MSQKVAELASPIMRLLAYLLDGILMTIISFSLSLMFNLPNGITFFSALIYCAIQSIFWSKGTSMAKSVLKLKVVSKGTDEPIGFGRMFIRETIGKAISGLFFSIGFFWILFDDNNQGWHDKLVNTEVVKQ